MAQLIWSPRSLQDLEIIHEYIAQDSEENASEFIKQLINSIMKITDLPFSGGIVPEYKNQSVREKLYKRYRIIYRIKETE